MLENSVIPSRKSALRAWARERRKLTDFDTASRDVVAHVADLPEFRSARNVLIYLALPAELNVEGLIAISGNTSRNWYVPRCEPNGRLSIHRFNPENTLLHRGPFGIREPGPSSVPLEDPGLIDLVLVPGLLYTVDGTRLGNGGGYYDRFLPRTTPECVRIGVISSYQVVDELPTESWDVRVSRVVTESGPLETAVQV